MHSPVRSFDLFDTLIGRLHYYPESIFYLVQDHFAFPGFALFRMLAESQSDRTLSGIYQRFQELTGITDQQRKDFQEFEFQIELTQVFPITENLSLVQDHDLIVSDTYYTPEQIHQILNKIGLTKQIHLYATPQGKSSGKIWPLIKQEHQVESHIGDSLHADVMMAKTHEIPAAHYINGLLSTQEQKIANLGNEQLAFLMRTLRLQNPYPLESAAHKLWNDQCQINIPILIEASLFLVDFCKKKKKSKILFTSRDGCLWIQIFQKLFPDFEAIIFPSSRYMYTFPTKDYIDYVQTVFDDRTMIADCHGTGISCTLFFKSHFKIRPIYLSIANPKRRQHAIVRIATLHESLEKLNYDLIGSLYDFRNGIPIRAALEYDPAFVIPSHECVRASLDLIAHYQLGPFNADIIRHCIESAQEKLAIDELIDHAAWHTHIQEDDLIRHVHVTRNGRGIEVNNEWSANTTQKAQDKEIENSRILE